MYKVLSAFKFRAKKNSWRIRNFYYCFL